MKRTFSTHWNSSSRPAKQRKYRFKAPLHIKKNFLRVNLSKELRAKYKQRNVVVKKGDTVKIMRGTFKKKEGKVTQVQIIQTRIYVDQIQRKKRDGSSARVPLRPEHLQIIALNLEGKGRFAEKNSKSETTKKEKTAQA